jgi:hypothetical protein
MPSPPATTVSSSWPPVLSLYVLQFIAPRKYIQISNIFWQVDEEQKPMSYTQLFKLQPDGAGSYFVLNDVFRLIYAA